MIFLYLKLYITSFLRKNSKINFLFKLKNNAFILDVGCGNESPLITKIIKPDCKYHGIDIHNYNQTSQIFADKYIIANPNNFHKSILNLPDRYDVIISNHNLEHVNNLNGTLEAMIAVLKKNGYMYIAFPSAITVELPSRKPTLNYYDDKTHKNTPPDFKEITKILKLNGCEVMYEKKYYQPIFLYIIGFLLEPFSMLLNKNLIGTWVYHGFESIIIAKKNEV